MSLQPCGTWAAYKRHTKAGEPPCEACAEASRRRSRARYRADPAKKIRQVRAYQRRAQEGDDG